MDENLKKWACSLSGCDGGNIKADMWLCGIEWGGRNLDGYYKDEFPSEIKNGAVMCEHEKFNWGESITYPYGISFAKLYTAIQGSSVESYSQVANLSGTEIFKANLYPIAFNSTNNDLWQKNKMHEMTGFDHKYLFNTWCFFNRFPFYAELRKKHQPKVIIGTGVDYLRDFLMCFGGADGFDKLHSGKISDESTSNSYERTYYWTMLSGKTLLIVIPFFSGSYGLNSNYLLQKMGSVISNLLEENN